MKPRLLPLGDAAILVQLGADVDPELNRRVHSLDRRLQARAIEGVIETVPAFASVLVHYDPVQVGYRQVAEWLDRELAQSDEAAARPRRRIEVPVRYGGDDGPDLEFVAEHHKISPRKVAEIHAGKDYLVYMMGFTPGFPYMGKLEETVATARLETPRTKVPSGSVGIAGAQTGIYPIESPGGWRLIGRTTLKLFDPASEQPFLFGPADSVRFIIEAVDA